MINNYISLYKKGGYIIEWKEVLYVEDKIINMMNDIYFIKDVRRYELEGSYGIRIYFKYNDITYEIMISKRGENIGFSICDMDDYNCREYTNKTIKNDNKCIYTIFKMIFNFLE